ncbi:activating transcription factor 7-interacting protein 1-like isoform X1 [Sinocyclocheilus anshuiensis]|uniref:Activating transcription factor 7-interacting protein 1-like n=2 Tax=Sinocyclocheilus anshuiensis TaxID=1608454 RepID=A0A671NZW1_9TELE|nr:PREDICTED: activating transcription factor 7-interacting protein 1-like isoform X1 [Sinocyclocheilus anshuiensis]
MISWFRSFLGTNQNLQNQICTKDPQATGFQIHEQESARHHRSLVKMEVAVPEEPQKKIFRARKTMKMSDRQQLEALHNTLTTTTSCSASYSSSSSRPQTPLVNGAHTEKEKEKVKEKDLNHKEAELMSPAPDSARGSPSPSFTLSRSPSPPNTQTTSPSMDLDDPLVAAEEKKETSNKSSSSSLSASPSGLNCDPEVKEGFLCLSEEDEIQADKDENKESSEEKMNEDDEKEDQKDEKGTSENAGADNSPPAGTKRSLSEEKDEDDKEIEEERDGKRARLEGEELEAQLELKITASAGSRHKLEKMVQQLVEERLRVLQLTVFDRSIKELKERVEKIDNANKQQNTVQHFNILQAKISRLAKKFGAANQASENSKRTQEAHAASAAAQANNATNMTTPQRTVKTMMDSKLSSAPAGSNTPAIPAQPKPLSTPTTPTSSALVSPAPILQIISTTTSSTPSSTSLPGQSQTGTLLLKTGPSTGVMTSTPATSGGQSVSIQPLLIQLPLAMANGQSGALVSTAGGVGLIPVSSLSTVSSNNKAKMTTPATTFILQKPAGNVVSSSSTSSAPAVSLARAVYPGGTGTVSSPSTGISVTTARTPTQCAAVVGVSTAASSPGTTGAAATGSAAAAAGPPSASALASKTDNQASTPKTPSQTGRPKGSVIDLTEDDDDVQVTGVQKATVSPITTQRASGPPPLVSSTTNAGARSAQRSSVDSPSRPSSSSSTTLPPLPLAPSPPARLPPEAAHTSPPQQPQLKLARVQSQNGIVLSWCVAETDRNCAAVDTYHLYAYHQDHQGAASGTGASAQSLWKKIGEVKALPLPMACTLTQFVSGSTYYFAVRAKDVYGRFGPFCDPQCTDVINPASS